MPVNLQALLFTVVNRKVFKEPLINPLYPPILGEV